MGSRTVRLRSRAVAYDDEEEQQGPPQWSGHYADDDPSGWRTGDRVRHPSGKVGTVKWSQVPLGAKVKYDDGSEEIVHGGVSGPRGYRKVVKDALRPVPELGPYPMTAEPVRDAGAHFCECEDETCRHAKGRCPNTTDKQYKSVSSTWRSWLCDGCARRQGAVAAKDYAGLDLRRGGAKDGMETFVNQDLMPVPVAQDNRAVYKRWARRANGEDAREKDTRRCGLCSKRLPNGHPFEYCNSCMRRLDAGEKPADIMRSAKDRVTLDPVPDGTRELRYTVRDSLSTPLAALAALISILAWFHDRPTEPLDYDLSTYQPKRRTW